MRTLKISLLVFILSITISAQWFWQNPLPQGNPLNEVFAFNSDVAIAVGDAGTIIKTNDGGNSWSILQSPTTLNLKSVFFINNLVGWAVGQDGVILKTTNSGASWISQISGTIYDLQSVYFVDQNTGWTVGDVHTILKTTNGGTKRKHSLVFISFFCR